MKKLLSVPVSHIQKSYTIRVARPGGILGERTELVGCWGLDNQLPEAWAQITADETVIDAQLFRSSQRSKPHQRRTLTATYSKQAAEVAS